MSLYKVGDTWYIDIRTAKGRIRRSTGTSDRKAAQEYHDTLKGDTWRQDRLGETPKVTWGQAVARWLQAKPRGLSDRYTLRNLEIPTGQPLPLPKATIEAIIEPLSDGTANRRLGLLNAIHNHSGITPPKINHRPNPKGRTRWLTAEEWQKLRRELLQTSPLLVQAADFTLATGLRENNVLNLEWSQIDLRRKVAWIYADQFKNGTPHGVPLTKKAMAVLRKRRGIDPKLVFGNPDYCLYKASNKAWYTALKAAKLYKTGVTWHTLRHTWASWAVMSGVRLEQLMHLGGWKSYSMVLRYAHLAPEHLAASAAKVKPVSRGKMRDSKAKVGHNLDIPPGG